MSIISTELGSSFNDRVTVEAIFRAFDNRELALDMAALALADPDRLSSNPVIAYRKVCILKELVVFEDLLKEEGLSLWLNE